MAEKDIGSLVVMEHGDLVGMLTFREVIQCHRQERRQIGTTLVRTAMDDHPLTCTSETELDEVRRMMLERHARYMPVMDKRMLMGVISFYDVAKAVVDSQNFENKMLKAYIRDWPAEPDHQRVAVGRGVHRLRHADGAARAAHVLDHHRLLQPLAQALGHEACVDVHAAAGRVGDDQRDGLGGGPCLRERDGGQGRAERGGEEQAA
jgi:CBS domain-containing protein